jgi:hypothetical protein
VGHPPYLKFDSVTKEEYIPGTTPFPENGRLDGGGWNMPKQAPLRLIKSCKRYLRRGVWKQIQPVTRGIYVLYEEKPRKGKRKAEYQVFYIGVGGVSKNAKSGVRGRIKEHHKKKDGWTHYSFFEVHDNVSREEILELESLFLFIFRKDGRIKLDNIQSGSTELSKLSKKRLSVSG